MKSPVHIFAWTLLPLTLGLGGCAAGGGQQWGMMSRTARYQPQPVVQAQPQLPQPTYQLTAPVAAHPMNPHPGDAAPAQYTAPVNQTQLVHLEPGSQLNGVLSGSAGPVLVDFYADWCGPCKKQGQVLNELVSTGSQPATIVKVNVEQHSELAEQYQVDGLPTLVVFKGGTPVARKTGFASMPEIASLLSN